MADIPLQDQQVDDGILAALAPAAQELELRLDDGVEGDVMVLWAVVVYAYLDAEGNQMRAYRRVNLSDWFEVGGAAAMLSTAYVEAWREHNASLGDDD